MRDTEIDPKAFCDRTSCEHREMIDHSAVWKKRIDTLSLAASYKLTYRKQWKECVFPSVCVREALSSQHVLRAERVTVINGMSNHVETQQRI